MAKKEPPHGGRQGSNKTTEYGGRTSVSEQPEHNRFSATPAPPRRLSSQTPLSNRRRDEAQRKSFDWVESTRSLLMPAAFASILGVLLAAHAMWSWNSLPIDIGQRLEDLVWEETGVPSRWVNARYGFTSSWRCPNWEAASFRTRGKRASDLTVVDQIVCCSATEETVCVVLGEE